MASSSLASRNTLPFPDEIIINILSYLPSRALLRISHTSRHLYNLSFLPELHLPHLPLVLAQDVAHDQHLLRRQRFRIFSAIYRSRRLGFTRTLVTYDLESGLLHPEPLNGIWSWRMHTTLLKIQVHDQSEWEYTLSVHPWIPEKEQEWKREGVWERLVDENDAEMLPHSVHALPPAWRGAMPEGLKWKREGWAKQRMQMAMDTMTFWPYHRYEWKYRKGC